MEQVPPSNLEEDSNGLGESDSLRHHVSWVDDKLEEIGAPENTEVKEALTPPASPQGKPSEEPTLEPTDKPPP